MDKNKLKKMYGEEKVLVVPCEDINFIGDYFTFNRMGLDSWLNFDNYNFEYRYNCEGNNMLQQIIPYVIIFNNEKTKVLSAKRVGGEPRLLGKQSIGFGGHINETDGNDKYVLHGACRELLEELKIKDISRLSKLEMIGYLRNKSDSDDLHDHLGIAIICHTDEDNIIEVNESENLEAKWLTLKQLSLNYDSLESWSKYLCNFFMSLNSFL